ncbi:MAG: phage head morphogenesis protein [Chloroflexota bacterium]|nr:phage head morphogenesis protein [Chloroflexota bacterium]
MPSELERAISRTRRSIDTLEGPVRQAIAAAYELAVRRIEHELAIVARTLEGQPIPITWFDDRGRFTPTGEILYRQQRLRQLLPQAEREFTRFADEGVRLLRQGHVRAVTGGAAEAWEIMEAAGLHHTFGARINTYATEQLVGLFREGPILQILDGYGARGSEVIERLMIQGIATGEGPRQIIKRIKAELLSPANAARLESLVRTEMMRGFRNGLNEQYASMSHLISGYRWSAAKSIRTCLACLGRDGMVQKEPWDQMHISCRCVNSPVVKNVTIPYQTGEEWFARQSPERQQRMMPSRSAWEAYRDGGVRVQDFVGVHRDRTWGSSVYQKSGREALEDAA